VVPQEYGIEPAHKVSIGLQIAWKMLAKLLQDMLAGMDAERHMEERVHRLDTSAMTDVRSGDRHVRTRLYFTSESHIHSLFNVLRWGSEVFAVQHDDHKEQRGVQSIFSDEARAKFDRLELGYLTHIVFRVLHKKNANPDLPSSYAVQVGDARFPNPPCIFISHFRRHPAPLASSVTGDALPRRPLPPLHPRRCCRPDRSPQSLPPPPLHRCSPRWDAAKSNRFAYALALHNSALLPFPPLYRYWSRRA
jgi:hypothetical protein